MEIVKGDWERTFDTNLGEREPSQGATLGSSARLELVRALVFLGARGKNLPSPHPLTPSPLTAAATMKDRGGEGVEDLGDGGSFAPPIPREFRPLPLPDSRCRESQPQQGEGEGVGVREVSAYFRTSLGLDIVEAHSPGISPDSPVAVRRIASMIGDPRGSLPILCRSARAAPAGVDPTDHLPYLKGQIFVYGVPLGHA